MYNTKSLLQNGLTDLKAEGKILNDDEIDALTTEEFDKIMEKNNGAS